MRTFAYIVTILAAHSIVEGQPTLSASHNRYLDMENAPAGRRATGGNCAPDRAEPIWGRDSKLLGYACVPASANGG